MKVKKNNAYLLLALIFLLGTAATIIIFNPIKSVIQSHADYGFVSVPDLENYFTDNQYAIDVEHYKIDIELFTEEERIEAEVIIEGEYKDSSLKQIELNFYDNMEISSLLLNDMAVEYKHDDLHLTIYDDKKQSQKFRIEIQYSGSPQNLGMGSFNFVEEYDRNYVYTLSEPVYASSWFPCNDLPTDKALAEIKITNDSSSISLSNGVLTNVESNDSRKTYTWETLYPISTYLIAIYSGKYEKFSQEYVSKNGDKVNFDYYVTPEKLSKAKVDFKVHPEVFEVFENLFGEYPFVKEKYAVVEFFWRYGAMEHQTITGMGSRFIGGNNFFTDILVHEAAHHWWGNAVGPATWKDIWLNEGFATYSEALYWEATKGRSSLISTLNGKFRNYTNYSLYNPGPNMFGSMVYNKGAWVLHMLRREIGEDNFFKLLRNYFERFKYKNASTKDFVELAEQISNKDLTAFFDQWVYFGKGLINLEYNQETIKEEDKFITEVNLMQINEAYDTYEFPLDIALKSKNKSELVKNYYITTADTTLKIISDFKPVQIIFDPDNWLMAEIMEIIDTAEEAAK